MDDKSYSNGINEFLKSPTGEEMRLQLSIRRESIIAKGKKTHDAGMWYQIEGFDQCCGLIYNAAEYKEQEEMTEEK